MPRRSSARAWPGLGEPEGLGDVVVGPGVEPDDGVDLVGPGGEDEHGHGVALAPQPATDLQTVHRGQAEVEDDEVGVVARGLEGLAAVGADVDVVALTSQGPGQGFGDRRVVLGEQHSGHAATVVVGRGFTRGAPRVARAAPRGAGQARRASRPRSP